MKRAVILIILLITCADINAQQQKRPEDARYRNIADECARTYPPSHKLEIIRQDSTVHFISDSGTLIIEQWILDTALIKYTNYFDSHNTRYRTGTVCNLLFRNNFLTHDNIIQALKIERLSVSQYGDTLNSSLHYVPGNIEVFRINQCPNPKYMTGHLLSFEIGFLQQHAFYSRYHFFIVLNVEKKYRKANLYKQINHSTLKCLVYQGFEI